MEPWLVVIQVVSFLRMCCLDFCSCAASSFACWLTGVVLTCSVLIMRFASFILEPSTLKYARAAVYCSLVRAE